MFKSHQRAVLPKVLALLMMGCAAVSVCTAVRPASAQTAGERAEPTPPSESGKAWDPLAPRRAKRQRPPLLIATDPPPPRTQGPPYPWESHGWRRGAAIGVSFGAAFVQGARQGYYGRLEASAYKIQTRRRGFIVELMTGLEGWGARRPGESADKGGSLPLLVYGGIQSDAFFAAVGAGVDVVTVDQVDRKTGVGLLSPLGAFNLGFDLEGVRFLFDARAGYRWQLGAEDRTMVQVGGMVQLTTD